jgi:DNA modification methylase
LGRKFIGFELNEKYVKMANDRISQLIMRDKYF